MGHGRGTVTAPLCLCGEIPLEPRLQHGAAGDAAGLEVGERGELSYGVHLSDTALMTCLVESATEQKHVHFIDGGEGGYTQAAQELKRRVASQRAARREVALAAAGV